MKRSKTSSLTTTESIDLNIAYYGQLYEDADEFTREVAEFRESILGARRFLTTTIIALPGVCATATYIVYRLTH